MIQIVHKLDSVNESLNTARENLAHIKPYGDYKVLKEQLFLIPIAAENVQKVTEQLIEELN